MKLYHYSNQIITKVWKVNYPECFSELLIKTLGFWVSVGSSWKKWCKKRKFRLENLRFCHRVYLHKKHDCLIIETEKQLYELVENYGFSSMKIIHKDITKIITEMKLYNVDPEECKKFFEIKDYINWGEIKEKYKGIIFKNYNKFSFFNTLSGLRNLLWYYSLDCDSGCIWDTSAIKEIRHLP